MSLSRRLALVVGGTAGIAIALAAAIAYVVTRAELRGQVDDELATFAERIEAVADPAVLPAPMGARFSFPAPPEADGRPVFIRVIEPGGDVLASEGDPALPPSGPEVVRAAAGETVLSDTNEGGAHLRMITAPASGGRVIQIGRSLEGVDDALADLRAVLFLLAMAGIAISALGARWIARRMLAPVASLTAAAEHISETEDLSRRIAVGGDDEVARLADRFNAMLERLESSRAELADSHDDQRRLIADASHELRTPVTSLRTNIELIAGGRLDDEERSASLAAAVAQAEELAEVVGDLMDLARGEAPQPEPEAVRLDELAEQAVERARRHAPGVRFALDASPVIVMGVPERLARAVNNLLDNAAEHAGGAPVEVTVAAGVLSVRDHGPGIPPGEEERIFDRFHRGSEARARPGAGLGLAIVRQVAEAHGGSVRAANAPGGGAVFSLQLSDFSG